MTTTSPRNLPNFHGLTEIIPGVFQLPLTSTSALLVLDEQVTIIDAGWKGNGKKVLNALTQLGRSPEEIGYIISTHYHLDHVGGISHLQGQCSATIAAHESEVEYLQATNQPSPVSNPALRWMLAPFLALLKPHPFAVDLPLSDGSRLETLGGVNIVHTPGHTPGSISLHFPQHGLLIVGDALMYRRQRLGLPSRVFSSNMAHARDSVLKLAQLDFDILCFSHFPPIRKNAGRMLRQFADSLT